MNERELKNRTKMLGLNVIKLVDSLPPGRVAGVLGNQLLRSATSVGANYRAACRARSKADFLSKLAVVEEEADESIFWLELLTESRIIPIDRIQTIQKEADEILSIIVASIRTVRAAKS